ncbi:tRNA lysidine(34) synthetase TilS [Candidatus Hoaglandella endobia]|uniref:tRNA(Ile)-lysidine synthase n=1 Tax=Candidatus Hoaglandella endobia TaxID=1778263 RepID=A0A143WTC0_9ENTR|nr:tRNA lysidine(34) synthetase TilS [Candidatus Hoaglandella endobia]CUX97013.1 tRNA(Ile)-lysidine synthase [Candidatus Hoaglandella endobia]
MKPATEGPVQVLRRLVSLHLASYHKLLLAYSGSMDSTVLLDILTALREAAPSCGSDSKSGLKLRALYVHHGLSPHADYWAAHCTSECQRRGVTFNVVRVVVAERAEGVEAAARSVRYQALATALEQDETLLTAHHQDDQVETLLLALKRGSGPAGLAAMASDAPFRSHRLVRPLLDCSRALLADYARECQLHWIEDDSNASLRFDRNFLRHCIIPPLRQRWPQFATTAARSAQRCAEQEALLDELLVDTLATLTHSDGSLWLTGLTTMSVIKRAAILRRWLAGSGLRMPSNQQLTLLWQQVALSRRDAVAQLQLDNWQIRRFRDRLYVLPLYLTIVSNEERETGWPPAAEHIKLPAGLGTLYRQTLGITAIPEHFKPESEEHYNDLNHTDSTLVLVRAPWPGARVSVRFGMVPGLLYISGRRHGRKLKKLWQELDIPPWQRGITPLLFYNETLIAALGVFITRKGEAVVQRAQWQIFWRHGNELFLKKTSSGIKEVGMPTGGLPLLRQR